MQDLVDIMQCICYIACMETSPRLNMKLARVEKGLSQQELADVVEVTRQTIGLIEKGNYNPTLSLCMKIARALDRTLDTVFWEERIP